MQHDQSVAIFDNYWSTTLTFAASLGRRGVPLHFYGVGAGRWSRYRARRADCPPVEHADRFLPWLERRVRSGEIVRVAPTTDLIAYYLALLRGEFAPPVQRAITPLDDIERCLIKTRFAAACAQLGRVTPRQIDSRETDAVSAAGDLGFPLIVKPRSHLGVGPGQRGLLVRDLPTLRRVCRPYPVTPGQESIVAHHPDLLWPLLQRYVPSARRRVYSVSGFKDADGGIVVASLSYKTRQWPPDTGISTCQITHHDPTILAAGLTTVDHLVSAGIFELELLDDDGRLLAIDLNPRAFGFMSLDVAVGNDLPWLWYRSTFSPVAAVPPVDAAPIVEARLVLPHLAGRLVGRWRGDDREPADAAGDVKPTRSISMLGHLHDPLPMLVGHWHQLRHPGGLFRPFMRAGLPLPDAA
jgi:D-aspartate ligase